MTTLEEAEFNTYGCASRCLIKWSEIREKPISKDDFVLKFKARFSQGRLGATVTSDIIEIARDLGLCSKADTLRDSYVVYDGIKNRGSKGAFVISDRGQGKDGIWGNIFHVRLITALGPKGWFVVWSPNQDGTEAHDIYLSFADLDKECAHFLVLL